METIMNKQPPTLDERIDAALEPDTTITAAGIAALIKEIETDIAKANQASNQRSSDPVAADQAMMATLVANRLGMSLPDLQARYERVHEREQAAAWLAEYTAEWLTKYDALKRERDALAEELREVYPDAATKIADLFGRVAVNNNELAELDRDRPADVEQYLFSAELHARGCNSFSRDTPSLLTSVHLVDWDTGRQICPPPKPSLAGAFAAAVPVYDRRCTADWAQDNERRAEAQRAEGQRHADFLVLQTKDQEERENREARERFDESQRKRQGGT
jgi:hypothetical protein